MKTFAAFIISFLLLTLSAQALEVPAGLGEYLPDQVGDSSIADVMTVGTKALWDETAGSLTGMLSRGLRSIALIVLTALICGAAKGLGAAAERCVELVGVLGISTLAAGDLSALIGSGTAAMDELHTLSEVLLPTVAMAMASGGFVGTAGVFQVGTLIASNFLLSLITELLLPLTYCYVGLCAASAILPESKLDSLAGGIKKLVSAALSGTMMLFTLYLTFSGVLSGSADKMAVRVAKTTVSAAIPVVGGILSEASEAVLAGASAARSICGVLGVFAVLFVCLTPLLHLVVQYILYKAAAILSSAAGIKTLDKFIEDMGSAFGLVLGMTGSCALLLLVAILLSITMAVV